MKISDLMISPPVTVGPETTARETAERMAERAVGSVLVTVNDTVRGVVTDRDLVVRLIACGLGPDSPVSELMSGPAISVDADDDLDAAYRAFRGSGFRRLPVLDGDRLVGVLTVDDLFIDVVQRLVALLGPVARSVLQDPQPQGAPDPTNRVSDARA